MRRPGTIARLRRAILAKDLEPTDVWRFFAHRVDADRSAVTAGLPVSSLGLSATNAVVGDRFPDPPSLPSSPGRKLYGIPFMVKDNFCLSTGRTTCASKALGNFHAPYTAPVIESLLQAGGLLIGKTNMDEFAMGSASIHNQLTGPVVNPWSSPAQAARIAGGSSGGSAAAVAAGLTPAAIASDTGGSCRLPAAFCGVTGYKPTFGLVSRCGLVPLANTLDSPSLIAPRVADIVDLLHAWMTASCERGPIARLGDSTLSLPPGGREDLQKVQQALESGAQPAEDARLRIGIPWEFHTPGMSEEVAVVWDEVAGWLADEFHFSVAAVSLPHVPVATAVYSVLCAVEVASNMSRYDGLRYGLRADPSEELKRQLAHLNMDTSDGLMAASRQLGLGTEVKNRILAGNFFLLRTQKHKHLDAARRLWRLIKSDFDEVFTDVDFLLTPVNLRPAPLLDEFRQLDSRSRCSREDLCTVGVNLAGLPAVTIPIKLSAQSATLGLPIGLQLIGPPWSEPRLLHLADLIEERANFPLLFDIPAALHLK
nr:unnamed protein product [Spirometra erinaceieuropaei]